ncbi:class I SAM-dependent methyltransferase [Thiothrix subterranea]|uniref:Class I SAM-dependent methyltransferase n=1 Tax=Thiothrix subterranea TaxID=2735563 RepID=A0ABU0Y755_9GAMM|nr:class I SAM-dependent methyltransferase [Thiothrix subterranea]MDQ5767542.1 class I SAM-dependent methyltransferase [Thiothrix subterranea]
MICKICTKKSEKLFQAKIINKHYIDYFHCNHCGFLQTEEPHWLEEAYSESINVSDTGYVQRNLMLSKKLTILLSLFFDKDRKFLDYAGGYGVFVRMMRDIGFDFYWDDKYTKNLFARGFEYQEGDECGAVTTFESFEHFVNPMIEIDSLLKISRNIIFSTETLPNPIPKPEDWWYYGLEHGQHISFYAKKTFEFIAKEHNLNYANLGELHLLSDRKISNLQVNSLKLSRYGLHKFLQKKIKSKTWSDYLKMSKNNENLV